MNDYNEISDEDGEVIVKTARKIVTEFLKNKTKIELSERFRKSYSFNAGVFVTLNNKKGLRGCIGYPLPDRQFFSALEDASIAASTEDPRFPPVKESELSSIIFEVTILTPPEKITVNDPQQYLSKIVIGRHGLIIKYGFNSGLLLPQVPIEYGWTVNEFLEHTCEKAGLGRDYWKNPDVEIQKFEGVVFKEIEPLGKVIREKL